MIRLQTGVVSGGMERVEPSAATHVELSHAVLMEMHRALSQVLRGLLIPRLGVVLGFDLGQLMLGCARILDDETHLLGVIVLMPSGEGAA